MAVKGTVLYNRIGRFAEAEREQDARFWCLASKSDIPRQGHDSQCRVTGSNMER